MRPRRCAMAILAGYAQASQATFGVTPALDGDGQSLRHGLSVRWIFDQRDANNGPPSLSTPPRCSDVRRVQAELRWSRETALPRRRQSVGGIAALCSSAVTDTPRPE